MIDKINIQHYNIGIFYKNIYIIYTKRRAFEFWTKIKKIKRR